MRTKKVQQAKGVDEHKTEDQGGMREPVDFVCDVLIHPWWLSCNKSANEVIRPVKKLNFLYL